MIASADNNHSSTTNKMNDVRNTFDYRGMYNGHKDGHGKGRNNGTARHLRSQSTTFLNSL